MHHLVKEVFHGHLRSIIGGLSVEDLIANRNELAQQTRDASVQEMQKLGLVVDSLQIQDIIDPSGYIAALGEPRTAEVKMQARIAQAAADCEATERDQEAEALKAAAQRDTAIKLAGYQAEHERATATTAQADPLADLEARKQFVVQETEVADLPFPERQPDRSPATKSTPSTAHRSSSSNSTAASSTPPHTPSNTTATATPTSSMRGSPTLRITDQRLKHHATHEAQPPPRPSCAAAAASRRSRRPRCARRPARCRRGPAGAPTPPRGARASPRRRAARSTAASSSSGSWP